MKEVTALLIFCEGPHDSAFIRKVLTISGGYDDEKKLAFSQMPVPFNQLFEQTVNKHFNKTPEKDMSLKTVREHSFFLPDAVLRKNSIFAFIYNSGGNNKCEKIKEHLEAFLTLLPEADTFPGEAEYVVKLVKYLFIYDANTQGIDGVMKNFKKQFKEINDKKFLAEQWIESESKHGKIAGDKAVFVWGESPQKGTLEDILVTMFKSAKEERLDKVQKLMKDIFERESIQLETENYSEKANYNKAVLTTAGQKEKPGSSLHVIIAQSGLIREEALESSEITAQLIKFINELLEDA